MRRPARTLRTLTALSTVVATALTVLFPAHPAGAAAATDPIPVSLSAYYDNDAISGGGDRGGNFDGSGYTFPADELPAAGPVTAGGVPYEFPSATAANNVVAMGQTIALPGGRYSGAYLLAASSYGDAGGTATVHYADGSTSTASLGAPDWYSGGGSGALNTTFRYRPDGTRDPHPVSIFPTQIWLDPARAATGITLPTTRQPAPNASSLHVFALSVQPVVSGMAIRITNARSTFKVDGGAQQVAATIVNVGDQWLRPGHDATVTVQAAGVRTVAPARVTRLAPGEEARVQVGVVKDASLPAGTAVPATVTASILGEDTPVTQSFTMTAGVPAYDASNASLSRHESPDWFNDSKFGIFIHWGVYSVPAWAPVGKQYAEWYWRHMNDIDSPTYQHHLETYGADVNYDDFIPQFKAQNFDPKSWVRLFQDAGAKYFVLTSKHHEGFSLFDTKYSDRNSVAMGPHQDLVKKLFDAARTYTPSIHPGLYYSLPEWYNPANPPGSGTFPTGGPKNPYTGQPVPYTGYKPINNYVGDFQVPQLEEIINNYSPEVLWCDIGFPATNPKIAADYFNHAAQQKQQVAIDNRCGIPSHDFTTPEYTTYPNTVVAKWESSRGLDPFSYGYNAATPDDQYMTADQVVDTLADIVSKNGNFLLDIGPKADGTIPSIMEQRLRETGAWLRVNGESVYGTTYWSKAAQEGDLRFTVRQNKAFYITSLTPPGDQVTVSSPVPISPGDHVTLLGYDGDALHWTKRDDGKLVIDVPKAAQASGNYAWVFKIS